MQPKLKPQLQRPENRDQIIKELLRFESQNAVDDFFWNDWHVWPFIRVWTAFRMEEFARNEPNTNSNGKSKSHTSQVSNRLKNAFKSLKKRVGKRIFHKGLNNLDTADIAFATCANRRQVIDGKSCHPWADSLRCLTKDIGVRLSVLETGEQVSNSSTESIWISEHLASESISGLPASLSAKPDWYDAVARWTMETLGIEVTWEQWLGRLGHIFSRSRTLEKLLKQINPSVVMVDCWYHWDCMSAILAAHRLGKRTVELQHGLQSENHPSYGNWSGQFFTHSGVVPETFWVWGEQTKEILLNSNNQPPALVVGGNIWLNSWTARHNFEKCDQSKNVSVLFTAQPAVEFENLLEQLVTKAPSNWHWSIRLHPKQRGMESILDERFAKRGKVNICDATRKPLYELFETTDVHLTGFSTCTLEALAFGIPSVVCHETGRQAFERLIQNGVAKFAENPDGIISSILELGKCGKKQVLESSHGYFARPETSQKVLRQICSDAKATTSNS